MIYPIPRAKRAFDVAMGLALIITVLPLLALAALGILILEGRPVFYVSRRRLDAGAPKAVCKFRTMRRDADRIANRDTVPVMATRFLNLPHDSPLYTPIGRLIERYMLTEMPQLFQVVSGRMSIIGNRPLPENVVASLRVDFPDVEDRFLVRCGLTGPVQLVGRDFLSDAERLAMEIAYCKAVLNNYSPALDLKIFMYTVLGGFVRRYRFSPDEVVALIMRHRKRTAPAPADMRQGGVLTSEIDHRGPRKSPGNEQGRVTR